MIVVPAAIMADPRLATMLTVRILTAAAGLEATHVLGWSVNGVIYDAAAGTSPLLDHPLPAGPDGQLQLTVWMQAIAGQVPYAAMLPPQMPAQASRAATSSDERIFAAIDASWNSIRQLETKVNSVRKQLDQSMTRLGSLNRDLSPEERRASDNKDTKDWLDARRWLRDSLATLSRFVKEIDMGTTSGAGQRHYFEDLHRQYVVPRIPFAGMEQVALEFESHAKILQNLVASAQAGLTKAGRDAEQRANGVLTRISSKSRRR
jgi:hypothetical protein